MSHTKLQRLMKDVPMTSQIQYIRCIYLSFFYIELVEDIVSWVISTSNASNDERSIKEEENIINFKEITNLVLIFFCQFP